MREKKRILAVVPFLLAAVLLFSGCNLGAQEKEFSAAGMHITLTNQFVEKEIATQTAMYQSQDCVVTALKEEFTLFENQGISSDMTLEEYAQLVIQGNSITAEVQQIDDLTCFEYEAESNGKNYSYFAVVYRGTDAYWLIQSFSETKNYEELKPQFIQWAKTVQFD